MKNFKFLSNNNLILYEGREVVYVGYIIYNPMNFEQLRRIRLRDEGGRIDQEQIDSSHPLWDELRGMDYYCI